MPRFRPFRPALVAAAPVQLAAGSTLVERRARAFRRVFPLLSTSIPTADVLASYLDEVLQP